MERMLPVIDDINRQYWEGARDNRLVLQRCPSCQYWVHPPRETCPKCQSETLTPTQASGKGKVYSWSVMHTGGTPGYEDKLPYAVIVVELDEQKGLFTIGNIEDCPLDEIDIGLHLTVTFEKVNNEITLPQWRRV